MPLLEILFLASSPRTESQAHLSKETGLTCGCISKLSRWAGKLRKLARFHCLYSLYLVSAWVKDKIYTIGWETFPVWPACLLPLTACFSFLAYVPPRSDQPVCSPGLSASSFWSTCFILLTCVPPLSDLQASSFWPICLLFLTCLLSPDCLFWPTRLFFLPHLHLFSSLILFLPFPKHASFTSVSRVLSMFFPLPGMSISHGPMNCPLSNSGLCLNVRSLYSPLTH